MASWLRGALIGQGATATVSLASTTTTNNIFAVKSAPLSHSSPLQHEQNILSSLNSPSILSYLGFQITKEAYNLFLEYAPGGSLADNTHCLTEPETRSRAREILSGLSHLHNAGIVHCDVKPGNVLIGSDGRAKIGDLGCARRIAEGDREIRGSPIYMAPEAVRGEEQGTAADLWSFGCTVIELATGRPPCDAVEGIRRIGFCGEAPAIPDWFSEEGKDFLNCCLRTDPAERWTADELLQHPFVGCCSSDFFDWVSPKSTLDLRLWEFAKEEEVEDDEEELLNQVAEGRIQEIASGSKVLNWNWDGDWADVRNLFCGDMCGL